MNADHWTVTDANSIPTGEIRSVQNSVMDLRKPTILGDIIQKVPGGGYDYNFCLPEPCDQTKERFVAKVVHPSSGRVLEVYSNQPGVQLYTSNFLPEEESQGIPGKNGKKYFKHGALCLETQNYPDAINHVSYCVIIKIKIYWAVNNINIIHTTKFVSEISNDICITKIVQCIRVCSVTRMPYMG